MIRLTMTQPPPPTPRPRPRTADDYHHVTQRAQSLLSPAATIHERAAALIDALWQAFGSATGPADPGYAWVGLYYAPNQPIPTPFASSPTQTTVPADQMILGHRRNKPACSPIGLQGMCGQCWKQQTRIVIDDVRKLRDSYIACDPADQSELVVPLFAPSDQGPPTCWAVLDVDSYAVAAFTEDEALWLESACLSLGLTTQHAAATHHPC